MILNPFFIIQILIGYSSCFDSRLPISLPVLQRLMDSSSKLAISEYLRCQFRAMCSTAFFALLQIGEMTFSSHKGASIPLQVHQVSKLVDAPDRIVALKVTFGNFKHNYNKPPFSLVLHRQNSCCPVQLLLEYLSLRGDRPGPLFLNSDNSPVPRSFFADLLSISLRTCGLDSTRYNGHSFCIGAASFAAEQGVKCLPQVHQNIFTVDIAYFSSCIAGGRSSALKD